MALNFADCPFVIWVDTFRPARSPKLEYSDLYNGVFLNNVMREIENFDKRGAHSAYDDVNPLVQDVNSRLQNWDILIRNIRAYYSDVLQQILIAKMPDITLICREPEKESSFAEIRKALQLILGCAVECERKDEFIHAITKLDISVQTEIAQGIQQIQVRTHTLSRDCKDPDVLLGVLEQLLKERDSYAEMSTELVFDRDYYQQQVEGMATEVAPTGTPEKDHLVKELTESKATVRKLKLEMQGKQDQLMDLKDECEEYKSTLDRLKRENSELLAESRSARAFRDELDILREKVGKVNSLESELLKYKERLNEMEFMRARVKELIDDNRILTETKMILEERLSDYQERIETLGSLEEKLEKYRQQIDEISAERDADSERISQLIYENAQLQLEKKQNLQEATNLAQEIENSKAKIAGVGGALSDQLQETVNSKLLRLQLENQRLLRKLQDHEVEKSDQHLKLIKDNESLVQKVGKLKKENIELNHMFYDLEEKMKDAMKEKDLAVRSKEDVKQNSEILIKELEQKNEELNQTVQAIRSRNEQTSDIKLRDLEKENKRLHETVAEKNRAMTHVEFRNRQLQSTHQKLQETVEELNSLENMNESLERKNMDLKHRLQTQELANEKLDKLERDNADMVVQAKKDESKIHQLQNKIETVEQEHINVTVENQKLQKKIDNLKNSATKVAELENEISLLKKQLIQQQKVIQMKKSQDEKLEKMELDLMDLDNENMRLQKQLEITSERMKQLEKDNFELEMDHEKLEKNLESSKHSQKRISELESNIAGMEKDNLKHMKENAQLQKESKRNRNTLEARESALDELATKYSMLELSYKELQRNVERDKVSGSQSDVLDQEHKELVRSLQAERQTVGNLKTELINEKRKAQELQFELDKLHQDLKVSILNSSEGSDSRFKALESMMHEKLSQTVSLRDGEIHVLESRLEESKVRNMKLQNDLRVTRRECESLKQRMEEESLGKEQELSPHVRSSPSVGVGVGVGDHKYLVQLERKNATLTADYDHVKAVNNSQNEQIKKMEALNAQLQHDKVSLQTQAASLLVENEQVRKMESQISQLQSEKGALQTHNAKLQVEQVGLRNQCETWRSQLNDLKNAHTKLVHDYDTLQRMHDQLTHENEALISEHGSLKSVHKTLKSENTDLHQQLNNMIHSKDDDNRMRDMLSRYNKLREDHQRLLAEYEKLKNRYSEIESENKQVKTDFNMSLQEKSEIKDRERDMESEVAILVDKYNVMNEMYQKGMEEKEALMNQVNFFMERNEHLIGLALNNKDQMAGQEKSYLEQLSDLRRQKERLEEKIMEHYKHREKQKKNKGFGAKLLQRMRGLTKSKIRLNQLDASPDDSSTGSGPYADAEETKKTDKRRSRHRKGSSAAFHGDMDSPRLANQNKGLAKSTPALDFSPHWDRPSHSQSDLRGSRSSDELADSKLNVSKFLPGLGKPVFDDDEGGFEHSSGNGSGNQEMTLAEFLAEGVDNSSTNSKGKLDLKSEKGDSTDHGGRRRKPAPPPPTSQSRSRISSIPDVALQSDHSMSRLSNVSTGSSESGQNTFKESAFSLVVSPTIYGMQPNKTSTPAKPKDALSEGLNGSAFSQWPGGQDVNGSYTSPPQYNRVHDNSDNRLTPDARLDMLTRGHNSAFTPTSTHSGNNSHHSSYSSQNELSGSKEEDLSVRSGHGSSSQAWNRAQQGQGHSGQGPLKATHPHFQRGQQQYDDRPPASQQSTPQRKGGNILVSRSNIAPRPYGQKNIVRARPASAFASDSNTLSYPLDQSLNSSLNSTVNNMSGRPPRHGLNNSQSDLNNSQLLNKSAADNHSYNTSQNSHSLSNGPSNNVQPRRRQAPVRVDRPKSVPPSMFNVQQGSDSDSSFNNEFPQSNHMSAPRGAPGHGGSRGTPPVPPPRQTKDILKSGKYTIMASGPPSRRGQLNNATPTVARGQDQGLTEAEQKEIWNKAGHLC
ncbi:girdin-like isoform X3 [Mya arenaria]|uniref:girdin-like isoform X3 n=1 Tax=Mya arenaria TaxID=6604 RepID=UPI0022E7ED11|nr:girdin-like isoform X3 [Mya arenaria]XP_052767623.1 girdin-like isoform X3 [Mya arenaria]